MVKKIVHQRLRWVREEGNTIVDNSFGVTTPFSSLQWEIYKILITEKTIPKN